MSTSECAHSNAWVGLDGCYCPDCQQTFSFGTKIYEQILKRGSGSKLPEDTESGVADDTKSSGEFSVGDASVGSCGHSHQFAPVWQSDCTLVSCCKCGEKRECDLNELRESLACCINLRAEYLRERDLRSPKTKQQEFARAIALKDRQIAWVERQIEERSLFKASPTSTSSYLALDEIRRDGGTQPRAAIDLKHVLLLEEQMEDGKELECDFTHNLAATGTIIWPSRRLKCPFYSWVKLS